MNKYVVLNHHTEAFLTETGKTTYSKALRHLFTLEEAQAVIEKHKDGTDDDRFLQPVMVVTGRQYYALLQFYAMHLTVNWVPASINCNFPKQNMRIDHSSGHFFLGFKQPVLVLTNGTQRVYRNEFAYRELRLGYFSPESDVQEMFVFQEEPNEAQ